ncbi:MAG TPA: tetratricopeptide repeat protein, partial [Thermoanaerobaculia bacterium]|nr:tetratricopeptide repeat protein [Thermoanaerobaculia bacterium]
GGGLRRLGLAAGIVVALGAVGFIGFKLGEPIMPGLTGTPVPQQSGATIDQAQISAYMTRLAADANDVEALQGLANVYFAAGDFATAAIWLDKLLVVEPDNIDALLGAGAVAYNLGRLDDAEDAWLKVLALEPDNVEVHYDLGFLYLAQEPPDLARVEQEWRRVIELDPDSDIAKTVATHLEGLVPAPSGSPAVSPEASEPPESAAPTSAPSAGG